MSEQNPTEKPKTPDDPWIRDLSAADIIIAVRDHEAASRACAGLRTHCAYCGAEFPMWPPKEYMGHVQTDHAADLTMQQLSAIAPLCDGDWNQHHVQYFLSFLLTWVPLRRNLRDLGLVKIVTPEEMRKANPQLFDGRGRLVQ